jgi:hypothetical protein
MSLSSISTNLKWFDFLTPLVCIEKSALDHNLITLARCARDGELDEAKKAELLAQVASLTAEAEAVDNDNDEAANTQEAMTMEDMLARLTQRVSALSMPGDGSELDSTDDATHRGGAADDCDDEQDDPEALESLELLKERLNDMMGKLSETSELNAGMAEEIAVMEAYRDKQMELLQLQQAKYQTMAMLLAKTLEDSQEESDANNQIQELLKQREQERQEHEERMEKLGTLDAMFDAECQRVHIPCCD